MKISELQKKLEELKTEHGDINVVTTQDHEYWGSVESYIDDHNINVGNAQPEGPKSGKMEKAVILGS